MLRLLKLHLGLLQYLRAELKKKRTLKDLIKFLKELLERYAKVMFQEYKNLFLAIDPAFQKQKKDYDKYNKLRVDLQRCVKMLNYIDDKLEKAGANRQRRRQFWRDFIRDGQVRKEVFDELLKEIG